MNKRYSHLIPSLSLVIDLLLINAVVIVVHDIEYLNKSFLLFANLFWIVSTQLTNYYKVSRQNSIFRMFSLTAIQAVVFILGFFSYFSIFREGDVVHNQFKILTSILLGAAFLKLLIFYALKHYRAVGMNYSNVVLIGYDETSKKIIQLFKNKTNLGYHFQGFFTNKVLEHNDYLGNIEQSYNYVKNNNIDELFCSVSSLNNKQIKELTKFANKNAIVLKLIPEANELYSKNVNAEYYDNTLILNVKRLPLEIWENRFVKRSFDIVFSFFVLVFIMSWLIPLLWLVIKLESKGPVLFKQEREGIGGNKFTCYKFRSMKLNKMSDSIHATKNDERVTRIGSFMRKTSIDELPQFFNVLKGDMSIVGPRPHMSNLSVEYQKEIDNYMERHTVRPGITGLAQISGYRGEVKKKSDIKNRIRLDIFYIENWSFFLDLKIIMQTVFNVFKGEEKAY